ncbi:MAG: energy transducer TonB [Rhizobiales bacterium]|nr:energy transducer TonB [Hyphomicrobiales bacterium]
MRWSLITSLALHASILVAALIVLPNPDAFKITPQESIQVDISTIADQSKRMAMVKEAEKPKEKPAPKKAETVKKSDPAPKIAEKEVKAVKEASAEEPLPPEPKKEEPKPLDSTQLKDLLKEVTDKPEPKKEEVKKEPPKKAEVKPKEKPKKKKEKFDVAKMEAFLNKVDESQAPEQSSEMDSKPAEGETNLQGTDDQLSATIIDALVQRIRECWTVPPGAREAEIVVKVQFGLNTDGSVIGVPVVMNHSADPLFDATARSTVAAVLECQAYSFLPQEKYDLWKDLIINFNPNMS